MKKNILIIVQCIVLCIVINSCKKSDSGKDGDATKDTICEGNGGKSWLPLAVHNQWKYTIESLNLEPKLTVINSTVENSKTYWVIRDSTGLMQLGDLYLREDPKSHNLYALDLNSSSGEFLYLPASPELNQSWMYFTHLLKVTNLAATYSTSTCSYSDLLEVSVYDGISIIDKHYYKKGLGLVGTESCGAMTGILFKLNAVKLY
ncbi:MAG: hypothetical protein WCM76_03805 [Bacteroidota bacterium]